MKRFFALLLILALSFTLVPFQANAAQGGKLIALTFDDGPDRVDTPRLLDGLKERGVPVTFFMLGQNVSSNQELVQRAYDEGHEIASHTWDHPNLNELNDSAVKRQISRSFEALDKICGAGTEYLVRPPYGNANQRVRSLINVPLIYWSVDTLDWKYRDKYTVRDTILNKAYDGAIILLHDIHGTSVDGALLAIDKLLDRGYELVTVSELYRRRGVSMKNHEFHYDCRPNGTDLGPIITPEITYTTNLRTMEVTITSNSDVPIYYTTDGSVPNQNSKRYTGPFTVSYPSDIKAVAAYKFNGSRSDVAELVFGATSCNPPSMKMDGMTLSFDHPLDDVNIYYTLDGSDPATAGILYTGPVEIEGNCFIRAAAGGVYYKLSREVSRYCTGSGILMADVKPTDWYFEYIDRLSALGHMDGVGNDCFNPNGKLNRAMMVTLLYRCSGDDLGDNWEKTHNFIDVPYNAYYSEAVEWAFRNGVVDGFSPTSFKPSSNLTREQMCKIIDCYLTYKQTPLADAESCSSQFVDYSRVSMWARPFVDRMVAAGLINGSGNQVLPQGTATRAEAAAVLIRMLDYQDVYVPETAPDVDGEDFTEPSGQE